MFTRLATALVLSAALPASGWAATLTYQLSGVVYQVPSGVTSIQVGDALSATLVVDLSTIDSAPSPNLGAYSGSAQLTFMLGSVVGGAPVTQINIFNDSVFGDGWEMFGVDLGSPNECTPQVIDGNGAFCFAIGLGDPTGTAFASDSLVIPTDLSLFTDPFFQIELYTSDFILARLTSIQLVPEPSALWLLGIVGATAVVRRRRAELP